MHHSMQVDYPEFLPDILAESRDEFENEARMAMAAKLFELRKISSGHAAQIAGVTRVQFLLRLHSFGVSAINIDADELERDFDNA